MTGSGLQWRPIERSILARQGRKDALDATCVQGEWSLTQHVDLRGERAEHMWLVQMIRGRDDHGVEIGKLQ